MISRLPVLIEGRMAEPCVGKMAYVISHVDSPK
jgi:hypothetical protein